MLKIKFQNTMVFDATFKTKKLDIQSKYVG